MYSRSVRRIVASKHWKCNNGNYPNVFWCFHSAHVERKQNRRWTNLRCLGNCNIKTQHHLDNLLMLTPSNVLELHLSTISCPLVETEWNHWKRKASRNYPNWEHVWAISICVAFPMFGNTITWTKGVFTLTGMFSLLSKWRSDVQWSSVGFSHVQWSSLKLSESQWSHWSSVKANEIQCSSMKFRDVQWRFMKFSESPWRLLTGIFSKRPTAW